MSTVTVYVPVTRAQAEALAAGGPGLDATGYAVTADLREAHGLTAADDEDAGYTALGYAGLAALLAHPGLRLVLAADVAPDQVRAGAVGDLGQVEVTGLVWAQVQALFADEAGSGPLLDAARAQAGDRGLAAVADDEAVADQVDACDLLWFAPQELPALD